MSSSRLGALVQGSYKGEVNPLGWLEDRWDKQEGYGKPAQEEHMLAFPQAVWRGQREVCSGGC